MRANLERYLDAATAARRTGRQISQQEAAWDRWAARARMASALGDERLAEAARCRALVHGEAAAWLRTVQAEQDALVRRLASDVKDGSRT